MSEEITFNTCRVCELLDGDTKGKHGKYCKACKAFICDECENNLVRRGKAMFIDKLQKDE